MQRAGCCQAFIGIRLHPPEAEVGARKTVPAINNLGQKPPDDPIHATEGETSVQKPLF